MPFGFSLVEGFLLALGTAVFLVGGRFLIALARRDGDASEALQRTGRWSMAVIFGAGAAGSVGLIQLGDILGSATGFIATHPFAVSNGLITGLGAGVSAGLLSPSPEQFVGLAMVLVGLVLVTYEVADE